MFGVSEQDVSKLESKYGTVKSTLSGILVTHIFLYPTHIYLILSLKDNKIEKLKGGNVQSQHTFPHPTINSNSTPRVILKSTSYPEFVTQHALGPTVAR